MTTNMEKARRGKGSGGGGASMIFIRFTLTKLMDSPMCPQVLNRPKGFQFCEWVRRFEVIHGEPEQLSIPEWMNLYEFWRSRIRNRTVKENP